MQQTESRKLLIIRFSSFGDILQASSAIGSFLAKYPGSEIHWATRSDFVPLLSHNPNIHKIWPLNRKEGLKGLWSLLKNLQKENYTHVYDAHNNLRSRFLSLFLWPKHFVRRGKSRLRRFLIFKLRIKSALPKQPARDTFIRPLEKWGIPFEPLKTSQLFFSEERLAKVKSQIPFQNFIALIPSSAWDQKRWPIEYWKRLIDLYPEQNFVIFGGPQDHFLAELVTPENQNRLVNTSGAFSLIESCAAVSLATAAIGCDTGLTHAADQLGLPVFILIGPSPFGYPARPTSKVLETSLWCKPCSDGSGRCKNRIYKKCLYEIKPEDVAIELNNMKVIE